jgi:LmbE family N-acetylglucosaminyl deacetylase
VPALDDNELMLAREQEQRAACEVYGVQAVEFLRFPDGHLSNSEETRKAVVRLIRKYRPRVVITHDPTQHIFAPDPTEKPEETAYLNHTDHRATGNIVLDAIFPAAGNPRSYRELLAEGLQPYKVHEVYFFMSGQENTYIDIGPVIEQKAQGLRCHASQFGPEEDMSKEIKEWGAGTAKEAKKKYELEMEYAESFRRIKLHVPKPLEEPKEKELEA